LTIFKEFIPTVTGRCVSDLDALPAWMGGLLLCNPSANAGFDFDSSLLVTSSLIQEIIKQRTHFRAAVAGIQYQAKAAVTYIFKTSAAGF